MSEKSKEQLKTLKERIKISFNLAYHPTDLAEPPNFTKEETQFYTLFGTKTLLLSPISDVAYLPEWKFPKLNNKKFEPYLTVNVVSTGDGDEHNLLDCSIYSGPYPKKSREQINIQCKLIKE